MADVNKKVVVEFQGKGNLSNTVSKTNNGLKTLQKTIKITAATFSAILAAKAIKATLNFAKLGTQMKEMRKGFKNLATEAGADSNKLLKELNSIAKGTISQFDLIQQSNQALLLMGQQAAENLPELLQISRDIAIATGKDVSYMFESLALGISRESRLLLDNVGIVMSVEKANETYARMLGKKASQLTDAERKQAFLNATLEAGRKKVKALGVATESSGDNIKRLVSIFNDLKVELAERIGPEISKFAGKLNKLLQPVLEVLRATKTEMPTLTEEIKTLNQEIENTKNVLDNLMKNPEENAEKIAYYTENLRKLNSEWVKLALNQDNANNSSNNVAAGLENVTSIILKTNDGFNRAVENYKSQAQVLQTFTNTITTGLVETMKGTEGAFGDMLKRIVIMFIEMGQKVAMASVFITTSMGLVTGIDLAKIPTALAQVAGLEALKAGVNALDFGGSSAETNDTSNTSSIPSASPGETIGSTPTAPTPVSSGSGGVLNINVTNPTFLSASDFARTVDELMKIAQENGWNVTLNSSVSVAES